MNHDLSIVTFNKSFCVQQYIKGTVKIGVGNIDLWDFLSILEYLVAGVANPDTYQNIADI